GIVVLAFPHGIEQFLDTLVRHLDVLRDVAGVPDDLLPTPIAPHPHLSKPTVDRLAGVWPFRIRGRYDRLTPDHDHAVSVPAEVVVLPLIGAVLDDVRAEPLHDLRHVYEHVERVGHDEVVRVEPLLRGEVPAQQQVMLPVVETPNLLLRLLVCDANPAPN